MTLTDTGPIVAILDRDDSNHTKCVQAANQLPPGPMLTSWPCFVEAMYLLGAVGRYAYQAKLWGLLVAGRLALHDLLPDEIARTAELMRKYEDRPMDLADASIVAIAEARSLSAVFTLDGDFRIYRLADGSMLDLVP